MSIENLKNGLPEYAKDLKLNLSSLTRSTELTEQQLWGTFVAAAAATKNEVVFAEVSEEAKTHLSDAAFNAALAAASIMGMNNIAYRAKGFLGADYAQQQMGLRMNIINSHGIEGLDFELFAIAVSAINGCEHCTIAHEKKVRGEGATQAAVWETVKIAATLAGVAQVVTIENAR